jgi:hypothetical protein
VQLKLLLLQVAEEPEATASVAVVLDNFSTTLL